jgi:large subunit ribosomal protein L25
MGELTSGLPPGRARLRPRLLAHRTNRASLDFPAVAGERVRLEVQERERSGSAESRRLRRAGLIPGVLYGRGKKPHAISVPERELRRVLSGDHGLHAILDVVLEGQKASHASILKEFQRDPIRGKVIHVDLQEVRLDQPIQAQVSVELVGEAAGSKEGGVLSQVTREINVEALPLEMPDHLELDVSGMAIGDTLRISDLPPHEGATYFDDPETVLATVTMPSRIVEPELEELEEGVEVPEGEEAPEGAAEAPAETGEEAAAGEAGTTEG